MAASFRQCLGSNVVYFAGNALFTHRVPSSTPVKRTSATDITLTDPLVLLQWYEVYRFLKVHKIWVHSARNALQQATCILHPPLGFVVMAAAW